jgi:3-phenylpropionate/trans-cinnamate dioxygenase ferredoxin subunit
MSTSWCRVAAVTALETGTVTPIRAAGRELALASTPEGVFAFADRCTHAETRMSEGHLRACRVTCPLHGASFDVRDGRVLGGPASGPLTTYPVRISGGHVEVLLPDPGATLATGTVSP